MKAAISYVDPRSANHVKMDRESVKLIYDAMRRNDAYDLCPHWPVSQREKLDKALDRLMTAMSQITDLEGAD